MRASNPLTVRQLVEGLQLAFSEGNPGITVREFAELNEAITRGQAKGTRDVANALYDNALAGNAAAQIFYLKARAGWAERVEITGRDGSPITLVALREQFAKEIEAKRAQADNR